MDTSAFTPSALTYRRFEQRVYRARWLTLPFALAFVLLLHPSALWLSLIALAGYALHNLIRGVLIARGTLAWFQWGGGTLLALDCAIVLLGIWPMLDTGEARAVQIVPLILLMEVVQRLRLETWRVLIVGTTSVTVALIAYALIVARHGGTWRNTAI